MKIKIAVSILGLLLTLSQAQATPLWNPEGSNTPISPFADTKSEPKPLTKEELLASLGNEGAHGGDPYAQEFAALAKIIVSAIRDGSLAQAKSLIDPDELEKKLHTTLIYSAEKERVILHGREVSAINNDGYILINATRWRVSLLAEKMRLVFHESLGILNVERDVYKVSEDFYLSINELAKNLIASGQSPGQYYGFYQLGYPLLANDTSCAESSSIVSKAISFAESQALTRCQAELGQSCSAVGNIIERQSDSFTGTISCKVTTLAK